MIAADTIDRARLAELRRLQASIAQKFAPGALPDAGRAEDLLILIDDLHALLGALRATSDDIRSQLGGTLASAHATSAYGRFQRTKNG